MPEYEPTEIMNSINPMDADLFSVKWKSKSLAIVLRSERSGKMVKVAYRGVLAWRVLDGFPIAKEDAGSHQGLLDNVFSYMVKGSRFWEDHSLLLSEYENVRHYRILTGNQCIDVLSDAKPRVQEISILSEQDT